MEILLQVRLEQKLTSLLCAGLLFGFSVVEAKETTDTNQLISAAREIAFEIDDERKRWRALVGVEGAEALFGDRSSGKAKLIALGELAEYHSDFQLVMKYLLKLGAIEEIDRLLTQSGPLAMNFALQAVSDQSYDDGLLNAANLIGQPFERAFAFQIVGIKALRGGHVVDALAALEEVRKFAPRSSILEVELLCELAKHQENSDPYLFAKAMDDAAKAAKYLPRATIKSRPRDQARSLIAQTWASGGHEKQTLSVISQIGSPEIQAWAHLDAALAAAQGNYPKLAKRLLAAKRKNNGAMSAELGRLVSIDLALGNVDAALAKIPEISESCDAQASAIASIARYLIDLGEFAEAKLLIDRIAVHSEPSVASEKALLLENLASRQMQIGDFDSAKEIVDLIPRMAIENGKHVFECAVVRGQIAGVGTKNVDSVMAAISRNIAYKVAKRAFGRLAEEMASEGLVDEVLDWATDQADREVELALLLGVIRGQNKK